MKCIQFKMGLLTGMYLVCVARGILVSGVLFWRQSCYVKQVAKPWGIFVTGKAARENPACHISYDFWMLPAFVTLVGTLSLPNQEEWCNRKLICKWGRQSITIKSWTKTTTCCKLRSRQSILKLLQTWETKIFILNSHLNAKKALWILST